MRRIPANIWKFPLNSEQKKEEGRRSYEKNDIHDSAGFLLDKIHDIFQNMSNVSKFSYITIATHYEHRKNTLMEYSYKSK